MYKFVYNANDFEIDDSILRNTDWVEQICWQTNEEMRILLFSLVVILFATMCDAAVAPSAAKYDDADDDADASAVDAEEKQRRAMTLLLRMRVDQLIWDDMTTFRNDGILFPQNGNNTQFDQWAIDKDQQDVYTIVSTGRREC